VIVDNKKFNRLIKKIIDTEEEEISCSDCFDLVSDYVDAELAGIEIKGVLQQVQRHLGQCRACYDDYEMLYDFVKDQGNAKE